MILDALCHKTMPSYHLLPKLEGSEMDLQVKLNKRGLWCEGNIAMRLVTLTPYKSTLLKKANGNNSKVNSRG